MDSWELAEDIIGKLFDMGVIESLDSEDYDLLCEEISKTIKSHLANY
jgi:hypothetical protein